MSNLINAVVTIVVVGVMLAIGSGLLVGTFIVSQYILENFGEFALYLAAVPFIVIGIFLRADELRHKKA